MMRFIILHSMFLSLVLSVASCKDDHKPTTELLSEIFFYAEDEQASLPFDSTTGARKSEYQLKDISKGDFNFGHVVDSKPVIEKSPFPRDDNMTFIVDGYHALSMTGEHVMSSLHVADAFLELAGQLRAKSVSIGLDFFRVFILPAKKLVEDQRASVLVSKSLVAGSLQFWHSNHLTIAPTGKVLVTSSWKSSTAEKIGLTVDSPRRVDDKSDLWRLWNPSVDLNGSTITAPSIRVLKDSSIALRSSSVVADKFETVGAVVGVAGESKVKGNLVLSGDSYLFFDENSEYQKKANSSEFEPVRMRMASLEIEGAAKVDAKISMHVLWMPGDLEKSRKDYETFFNRQQKIVLLKAQHLSGHASLISQNEAQKELGHYQRDVNYVEEFARYHKKKFALEHDYVNGTISLRIINEEDALARQIDAHGRLPDIGNN